ncbi:MAG TPA: kanamycin nucleotidyltransferase C-terminal domain-containing protein [Ktedonobacteraceae bacterium]|nr:kanamycin nucleotidyltransferase C-terminal domain-containing protein [Ktedonobacteraceae bacterium]
MHPVPEPMEHQQRIELAQMIAQRLIVRHGKLVKAIGLYGSLARNEDGPYSDVEMFCVLREPGETRNYEWCTGPWKAEVNVIDEASLRQEASQVGGRWALTHGAFMHVLPLTDPENYFDELRELVLSHPSDCFREVIEEVLIGDIYELIGKIRNAHVKRQDQALAVLAVELTHRTAYALGLEHRHLYRTSSSVLDEAIALPHPPEGFHTLARMVMTGNLQHAATIVSVGDMLWLGLVH